MITMHYLSPYFERGNATIYGPHFGSGWASYDFDEDTWEAANCGSYGDVPVTQHYSACWAYNLGADANVPYTDAGWGPHVNRDRTNELGLTNDGTTYTRVRRISRFVR
jgi:hypothetical protein